MIRSIAAFVLLSGAAVLAQEPVEVYTSEDLDRMFGPPPPPVSDPVDKSGPEDWGWVEGYLDRQYARIDADREYELKRRAVDIADERTYAGSRYGYGYYGGYAAFGLRYPASVWYNNVSRIYRGAGYGCGTVRPGTPSGPGTRPPSGSSSRPSPRSGGRAHARVP